MDKLSKFAENLNDLMFDAKITAEQLSAAIGAGLTTVNRWKRDASKIRLSHLLKLADFFACSLDFLTGRSDTELDYTPLQCPPFFEQLRLVMEKYQVTRYRIVKDTKIYDSYFTNWKNGADPHILTLIDLANYFNCSVDSLVGRDKLP